MKEQVRSEAEVYCNSVRLQMIQIFQDYNNNEEKNSL